MTRTYNRRRPMMKRAALPLKQKTAVRRMIKDEIKEEAELKYLIGQQALVGIANTASIVGTYFDVSQGITDNERIGDGLKWSGAMLLHLEVRASLASATLPGDGFNTIRMVILQWHPNSTPTVSNILLLGPTGQVDINSHYNHDTRQQYKILHDKNYVMINGSPSSALSQNPNLQYQGVQNHRYTISLKRATKKVQYTAGTLTGTNRFYMILVSDSSVTPYPSIQFSTKIFYTDS